MGNNSDSSRRKVGAVGYFNQESSVSMSATKKQLYFRTRSLLIANHRLHERIIGYVMLINALERRVEALGNQVRGFERLNGVRREVGINTKGNWRKRKKIAAEKTMGIY